MANVPRLELGDSPGLSVRGVISLDRQSRLCAADHSPGYINGHGYGHGDRRQIELRWCTLHVGSRSNRRREQPTQHCYTVRSSLPARAGLLICCMLALEPTNGFPHRLPSGVGWPYINRSSITAVRGRVASLAAGSREHYRQPTHNI